MNKLKLNFIVSAVFLSALAGCGGSGDNKPQGNPGAARTIPVDGIIIKEKKLDFTFTTTGTLLANEEIELRNEVSGKITGIYFAEGSWAQKGDLLVKINDQDLQAQKKKILSQIELARDEEQRKKALFDQRLASKEEYDISANKLKVLEAEKDLILAQIAKTEIIAPFSGRIGLRTVSPGAYVSVNTPIASLQQTDPIKIEFMIPDRYHAILKNGTPVRFRISGDENEYNAAVYAMDSRVDHSTRTMRVRARKANPGFLLKPGTLAKIDIKLETIPRALMIPAEALIPELSGQKIFRFAAGVVRSNKVQTGLRTETEIQITDGIAPGDTVITSGLLQIREGSRVNLKSLQ